MIPGTGFTGGGAICAPAGEDDAASTAPITIRQSLMAVSLDRIAAHLRGVQGCCVAARGRRGSDSARITPRTTNTSVHSRSTGFQLSPRPKALIDAR
jgi:hypothetical protein